MPQSYPVAAIAQLLKLSERRIQQLVKDGIIPRPVKGEYEPIGCIHGYIDYLKKLAAGNGELSLTDERTRLTKYQADLAEIQLKKERGELITSAIAIEAWGRVVSAVRQKLLALSTRLAPVVATTQSLPEIKERIDSATHEVLNELANPDFTEYRNSSLPISPGHAGASGNQKEPKAVRASPPPHRKPVGGQKKEAQPGK